MKKRNLLLFIQTLISVFVLGIAYFYSNNLKLCSFCFMILFWGYVFIYVKFRVKVDDKIIYDMSEDDVVSNIRKNDSNFLKDSFYIFVKNFLNFYYETSTGDNLDNIKHFVSNDIYLKMKNNVEIMNKKDLSQVVKDVRIKGMILKNYYVIDDLEYLEVLIDYKKNEFLLNKDKKIVQDITDESYKKYVYTFCRKIGSSSNSSVSKNSCSGCGANNSNLMMGVCIRCGTVNYNYGDFILCKTREFKEDEEQVGDLKLDIYIIIMLVIIIMALFIIFFGYDFYMFLLTYINISLILSLLSISWTEVSKVKRTSDDVLNIEGLADDNMFLSLDLNQDGYVGLNEYFTKTEDEVEKIIKEKCPSFCKDEFYKYVIKNMNIIEDGNAMGDCKLFSGYLNYNYYKRLEKNISVDQKVGKLIKVVGVVLKDCIINDNIISVKVAITLKYASDKTPSVYLLTYINNLNDEVNIDRKCINCGAALKNGICSYCGTYNYFSYVGFILNDRVLVKI